MATKAGKKAAKRRAGTPTATEVIHIEDGEKALVGVKALRVMLCPDGGMWFAQGLEIDYAAAGASIDEAKANFETGLALTIQEHLTMHGDLKKFLRLAPEEVWHDFLAAQPNTLRMEFSTIEGYEIVSVDGPPLQALHPPAFPFQVILFIEPKEAVAA